MPYVADITIVRGTTKPDLVLRLQQESGDPFDGTGSEFRLTIKRGSRVILQKTTAPGGGLEYDAGLARITWVRTEAETALLPFGRVARYELERIVGTSDTSLLAGDIIVTDGPPAGVISQDPHVIVVEVQGEVGPAGNMPPYDRVLDEGKVLGIFQGAMAWIMVGATVITSLTGTADAASAATGSLTRSVQLQGLTGSTSGTDAALRVESRLAGTAAGASATTAVLTGFSIGVASSSSTSQAEAAITVARRLRGDVASTSIVTGALAEPRLLTGVAAGQMTIVASLTASFQLTGVSFAQAAALADLTVGRALIGASSGTSQASGVLVSALVATVAGASASTASLAVAKQLAGGADATVFLFADLLVQRSIAGTAAATTSCIASLGSGSARPATTGVLASGDSIVRGFGLASPTTQNFVAQFAALTSLPVYNDGIDGKKLQAHDADWATSGHAGRYSASTLNTYLQEAGGADLRAGTTDAQLRGYIQSIIGKAKAAGYITFVTTILPQMGYPGWTSATEAQRVSYNSWLRNNYAFFADGLVDTANIQEMQDNSSTVTYQDYVHPTAVGAGYMAKAMQLAIVGNAGTSLSGTVLAAGSTQASLTVSRQLASTVASTSTVSGALAAIGLTATATSVCTVSGELTTSAGGTATQWSATDKNAAVSKTSATRVDRVSTAGATNGTIRSETSKASGRRYVEWKVEAVSSNNQGLLVGFATAAESLSNYLGQSNKSVGMWSSGSTVIFNGGANNTGFGNFVVGDIISADLNIDAGTVRFAKNNAWGGVINIATLIASGPVFVGATMLNVAPLTGTTANFGDSAFVYTPPSGAVGWSAA